MAYDTSERYGSDRPDPDSDYRWRNERYRECGDRYGRTYANPVDGGGSQEYSREIYGTRRNNREWVSTELWRVPGPHAVTEHQPQTGHAAGQRETGRISRTRTPWVERPPVLLRD